MSLPSSFSRSDVTCASILNDGTVRAIVPSTSTIAKKITPVSFFKTILVNIQTYHIYVICDWLDEEIFKIKQR